MRFAANPVAPKQPEHRVPASELIRRIVTGDALARTPAATLQRLQDLPAELDQRVRLVGEW